MGKAQILELDEINAIAAGIRQGAEITPELMSELFLRSLELANQYHAAVEELEPGYSLAFSIAGHMYQNKGESAIPDLLAIHLKEIFPEGELIEGDGKLKNLKIVK